MTKLENFDEALLKADAGSALQALEKAGSNAVKLVEAWVAASNAAAVATAAEEATGPARKAARRGINVLKSRGVSIPEKHHVASLAGKKEPETFEALLLPPDSLGTLLVVITARSPTSRCRAAFVSLNDEHGLYRVESGQLSQSQLKQSLAKATVVPNQKPVSVPVDWVRWRVAEARKRHAENGTPEPLGLSQAKSLLEPVPGKAPGHPFDDEGLELAEDDARDLSHQSGELHSLPEFRGWLPTREAMDELLTKVGETLEAGTEPDPEKLRQTMEEEVKSATDRYFSPQRREQVVRAMKDSALGVLQREGEQRALEVAATMQVIQNSGLITNPPHEVPFLRAFFDKGVGLLAAQGGGQLRIPVRKPAPAPAGEAPAEASSAERSEGA